MKNQEPAYVVLMEVCRYWLASASIGMSLAGLTLPCHADAQLSPAMRDPQVKILPVLKYDPNVNGGQPKNTFQIGGLQFDIPASEVAQSGLLAGASFTLRGLSEFGTNLGIQYNFNFQALTDERAKYVQNQMSASVCALSFTGERNLLSACASSLEERKSLSKSSLGSFEVKSETRDRLIVFGSPQPNWETSFGLAIARDIVDGRWRNRGVSSLGLHGTDGRSAQISVTLYEPISGVISDRYQVNASVENQKHFFSGINLTYTQAAGGNFFGMSRNESTIRLGVSFRASKNFTASVGYSQKDSSVDFYDATGSVDFVINSVEF